MQDEEGGKISNSNYRTTIKLKFFKENISYTNILNVKEGKIIIVFYKWIGNDIQI